MSLTHRFARRRDQTLRLRVVATGDDADALRETWEHAYRYLPQGAPAWQVGALVEEDQLTGFLTALATGPGPLPGFAARLRADQARLDATRARREARPPAGPVVDDQVLRALTHQVLTTSAGPGRVFDELGVAGKVRADIAVLGDTWAGFELKGHTDSLTRLPRQVAGYGAVFDTCTLVTTPAHLAAARALLPGWWGLVVAVGDPPGAVALEPVTAAGVNPSPDGYARAQLLWRAEALAELRRLRLGRGLSSRPRDQLWRTLAEHVDATEMKAVVAAAMAARDGWRSD